MTTPRWEPGTYATFLGPRTRPAVDLCAGVPLDRVETAVDLGCGPGNSTAVLAARWPGAALTGVDSSADMLARAATEGPAGVRWVCADLREWLHHAPPALDLLFSNATLQWVGDHAALFPRLLAAVRPGGVLAVQMPRNFDAPSHLALREVARRPRWESAVAHLAREAPVAPPERYLEHLAGAARLDVWETEYLHVLTGADPVLEWVSGTALVPFHAALAPEGADPAVYAAFRAEVGEAVRAAYPRRPDGTTVFPFRRLFVVATR